MTTFTVTAELLVDGAWLDITRIDDDTRVLVDQTGAAGITVSRGAVVFQGVVAPTTVTFRYLDNNSLLDGSNYASPYYRKIGLGTTMRVTAGGSVRAVVELSKWEIQPSGANGEVVVVAVEGIGVLSRLGDDDLQKPLNSPAYRALTSAENDATRVAYWPIEEESGATVVTSPVGSPGPSISNVDFGADTDSASSARLARLGAAGQVFFTVPPYSSGEHKVICLFRLPVAGLSDGDILMRLYCAGGNVNIIDLRFGTPPWSFSIRAYSGGVLVDQTGATDWTGYIDGGDEWFITMEFTQDGADLDTFYLIQNVRTGATGLPTDTLTNVTLGRIAFIVIGQTDCEGTSFGQLAVGNDTGAFPNYISPVNGSLGTQGFKGEVAGDRIARLWDEVGMSLTLVGNQGDTEPCGKQGVKSVVELSNDAVALDLGIFYDDRDAVALSASMAYRTRTSLYNQAPLMLSREHVSPPFYPTDSRVGMANDMTVSSDVGGSARYSIPDDDFDHWTTQDPPEGARRRPAAETVTAADDDQLPAQAAWRAHIRSWREKRFSTLVLELARPEFSTLERNLIRAIDIGDMISIDMTGSPPWSPYNEIRFLVAGYVENLSKFLHTITFNVVPADPYEVDQVDAEGSELASTLTDASTTMKITPPTRGAAWTTDSDDLPFNVQIDGDPVQITTLANDTPAFVAAGTAASGNNTSVAPGIPAGMADGGIMLLFAAIRNSGTGTVGTNPTGWRTLVDFGNTRVMFRYWVTGDAAPTVTFTNGVANADTFARIFGFSGLSHIILTSLGDLIAPAAVTLLNGSAQNMAYDAFPLLTGRSGIGLIFAWKQDDWTGVAPPSGYTEMHDGSTTTGDDQGAAAYYDLTGQSEAAGSLVVTGGASAISRTIALHLAPLQSAVMVREIAGTPVAHDPGAEIRGWRYGVNGL